jgi:hypothetical protein
VNLDMESTYSTVTLPRVFAQAPPTLHSPYMNNDVACICADSTIFSMVRTALQGYDTFLLPRQGIPFGRGINAGISAYRLPSLNEEATLKTCSRVRRLKNLVAKVEQESINRVGALTETKAQPAKDDHVGNEDIPDESVC